MVSKKWHRDASGNYQHEGFVDLSVRPTGSGGYFKWQVVRIKVPAKGDFSVETLSRYHTANDAKHAVEMEGPRWTRSGR